METEIFLLVTLIALSLPFLGYNVKLIIIALLVFFLCYPEQREKILNNSIIKETYQKLKESNEGISSNLETILIKEGNLIIQDLQKLKLKKPLKGQFISIQITWNNFIKLIKQVLNNSKMPYPHHHYETLKDHRKRLLNQLSSLIVGSSPDSTTFNLSRDEKIREFIKKMEYIIYQIILLLEKRINDEWSSTPYNKINQVQWVGPQPYDKDDSETIL
jgi:hypothetical protein